MNSRQTILLVVALLVVCSFTDVEARKRKKTATDKRPSDIEPELYCNACQAITKEVLKIIRNSNKDYEISAALDGICHQRNFSIYEYPPPDMSKGCNAFIMGWEEVIEDALMKRVGNDNVEHEICVNRSKACLGVQPRPQGGASNQGFVTVNNQKVPIGADGSVNMPSSTEL